jgi:hypothetical protein
MKEAMPAGLIGGVSQVHIRVLGESPTLMPFPSRRYLTGVFVDSLPEDLWRSLKPSSGFLAVT